EDAVREQWYVGTNISEIKLRQGYSAAINTDSDRAFAVRQDFHARQDAWGTYQNNRYIGLEQHSAKLADTNVARLKQVGERNLEIYRGRGRVASAVTQVLHDMEGWVTAARQFKAFSPEDIAFYAAKKAASGSTGAGGGGGAGAGGGAGGGGG